VSFGKSVYLFLTLGGLKTSAAVRVLDASGQPVGRLFAARACASSVAQHGKGYASGLGLGPGSFFGPVAGGGAAGLQADGPRCAPLCAPRNAYQ